MFVTSSQFIKNKFTNQFEDKKLVYISSYKPSLVN